MSFLIPLRDLVLIEPIVPSNEQGGIYVGESSKPSYADTARGKVVLTGYEPVSTHLVPGDIVYYRHVNAARVKHESKTMVIVPYEDVLVKEGEDA